MACEMFVLGQRDFRVRGLGSYSQTVASTGDFRAILYGLATMIGVIVLLDLFVWRPVIAWADKFKFEQVESAGVPRSPKVTGWQPHSVRGFLSAQAGKKLGLKLVATKCEDGQRVYQVQL
jgi:NitT/TauT family transport system permease protein